MIVFLCLTPLGLFVLLVGMHPPRFVRLAWSVLLTFSLWAQETQWEQGNGFRTRKLQPGGVGKVGFTEMEAASMGVSFTNHLTGDAYLTNAVAHNGAGLALGDIDGDGWVDLYFCNLQGANRLYRNLGGWRFGEMEIGPAVCAEQYSTGATLADVDGDRDLDLLVNGIGAGTRLFLNDGKGNWKEHTTGLSRTNSAVSMALADIDGDNDLDLYCTHYADIMHLADPTTRFAIARRGDRWEVSRVNGESTRSGKWRDKFEALPNGSVRQLAEADALYVNDGRGNFVPMQNKAGTFLNEKGEVMVPPRDWGLGVMMRDINGDLAPDIYVCNDMPSPDRVWINQGNGTFRAIDPAGMRHTSRSSMGLDMGDVDRDGQDDIFVLDMLAREHSRRLQQLVRDRPDAALRERFEEVARYNRNTLFFGRGDETFAEGALWAGVAATDWSWCPIFLDVDLDGFEDLLITNGFETDVMDQDSHDVIRTGKFSEQQLKRIRQLHPKWRSENVAFRNRGDGRFEVASREWGFHKQGVSYGMACADLDNDGDLEVVVNNLNDAPSIYRNDAINPRVAVQLRGSAQNTQGIGARVRLLGGAVEQGQEMICGGRYMSGEEAVRVFAASGTGTLKLEVTWRNGEQNIIENVQPNHIYEITQQPGPRREIPKHRRAYFTAAANLSTDIKSPEALADFTAQPLLPWRVTGMGPGVSWFDLDGDGWEDLVVGGSGGKKSAIFRNDQAKEFKPWSNAAGEIEALLGAANDRESRFAIGALTVKAGGQEQRKLAFFSATNLSSPSLLAVPGSFSAPLAMADVDLDGDLDLFVAERPTRGRYPEANSGAAWLNENGQFSFSKDWSSAFEKIGIVNGATFTDLDNDGDPDLALALEWGAVRVFRNNRERFSDVTDELGLAGKSGWWTGICSGDFDADGRMDLAVGNRGSNSIYELYRPGKLRLFYGDWNGDGRLDLLEAFEQNGNWLPVRDRTFLTAGIPEIVSRFKTHAEFSVATVQQILGGEFEKARWVQVNELESGVYLNRGGRFEWKPFPREAQLTATFSVNVADVDADGKEDLFLAQNFYGTVTDLSREDSGRGLWLRGRGDGTFLAVHGGESGIRVDGEMRGAAFCDYDHDGWIDLAVAQRDGSLKLFRNGGSEPNRSIAVQPTGREAKLIGAQMRLRYSDGRLGPGREISVGTGWWSQNAAAQLLGSGIARPAGLWVRFAGGKEHIFELEQNKSSVQLGVP